VAFAAFAFKISELLDAQNAEVPLAAKAFIGATNDSITQAFNAAYNQWLHSTG
jgi:hypothetical protein